MKIVADDKIPYLQGIAEQFAETKYLPVDGFTNENIREADVLMIRTPNKCTRQLLQGTKVRFIASTTIGFDHIDINYCREAGIEWTNCPGCNAASVGQYMISSLIELALKEHFSLKEKLFGIIGVGNVGKQVEKIYKAYGLDYLLCDPFRAQNENPDDFVDLQTIASECDIISFHVPLTFDGDHPTCHLANESFFQSLKKKPWIINVARGGIHDTAALLKAKATGKIRGMIIDCWENEPAISPELIKQSAIATPHIAGFSADGKANGTRMCLEAIDRKFQLNIAALIEKIAPPAPENPIIDLDLFPGNRIDQAILSTFSPISADHLLRESVNRFEYLRTHYKHPREFHAYSIRNANTTESDIFLKLGFNH